jgi:hypothetical protein
MSAQSPPAARSTPPNGGVPARPDSVVAAYLRAPLAPRPRDHLPIVPSAASASLSKSDSLHAVTELNDGSMDIDSPPCDGVSPGYASAMHVVDEDIMDDHEHSYSTDELDHCDDSMSLSSSCHADYDSTLSDPLAPSHTYDFGLLPPEIRELVYRELLLSDSAFRLGHHGPYSHEARKATYPAILRTCQVVFEEASNVLYGDNTFYLGKILSSSRQETNLNRAHWA